MLDSAAEIRERAPHVDEQEYLIDTFRASIDLLQAQKQELPELHDAQKIRADDLERITSALTRSLTSGFLALDPNGNIVDLNASAREILRAGDAHLAGVERGQGVALREGADRHQGARDGSGSWTRFGDGVKVTLENGFSVVAHLWSTRRRHGVLVRTLLPRENPVLESVVDLFPGAAWHERVLRHRAGGGHPRGREHTCADVIVVALPGHALDDGARRRAAAAASASRACARTPGRSCPS